MNDLFGIQNVSLSELQHFGFESFKKRAFYLTCENMDTISTFYDLCYFGNDKVPFYHCLPLLNTATNNHEYRYMLIDIEDDVVFIAYKVIQIMTTKQIRVFDIPVSKKGNLTNSKMVIETLKSKHFVKFAVQKCFLEFYEGLDYNPIEGYNNYFYSNSILASLPKRKLRGWRIKNLLDDKDFSFCLCDSIDYESIVELRNDFNDYLVERGSKPSAKDDKEFYGLSLLKDKNKKLMPIYYKGNLISLTVFVVFNDVVYNIYQMERKHYNCQDETLDKMLKYNMEEKTKYIAFKLFGRQVERIYILGAMPNEKRLIAHKERTSDGKIEYFLI